MAGHVQYYLDNMRVYVNGEYDTYVEEKFKLPQIHKDMFGSNDFCAMGLNNGELVIADFKYGSGLNVEAENNIQLIIYALGAYYDSNYIYDFNTVKLIVVQPRIEGKEWSEWIISVEKLLEFEEILKQGVAEVYSENPKFKTGDHCRFCKAKHLCTAMKEETEDLINHKFDSVPVEEKPLLPEVASMDKELIAKVLKHSSMIESWFKSVASHAHGLLEQGEEIEGYKLVKRKSNRKVRDEKELLEAFGETFGDKIVRTQLETLSKLEKVIGKKELEPYLIKPDTGTQIAPVSDKRPAVISQKELADTAFEEADKEDEFDDMEF